MKFYQQRPIMQQSQQDNNNRMYIDDMNIPTSSKSKFQSKREIPQNILNQIQSYRQEVASKHKGIQCCSCCQKDC